MKYSVDISPEEMRKIPSSITKKLYDKDDNVLFGSRYTKGKVEYTYIPGEFMETGNPLIISISVSYDGKGNSNLPEDTEMVSYSDLPKRFPDNNFK